MAIWDRFRRNRDQSVLPEEVKEYYQSENRQKRGTAIGIALIALIATVAIAAALFFGGRFVYDKIRGNDTAEQKPQEDAGKEQEQAQPSGDDNQEGEVAAPSTPTPAPAPSPAPAPAPAPSNPTTPALGDEAMPRTGDEGM